MTMVTTDRPREAEDRMREALQRIADWGDAYPEAIFREPDFGIAAIWLAKGGLTLDSVAASCMRHVATQVAAIAKEGLRS